MRFFEINTDIRVQKEINKSNILRINKMTMVVIFIEFFMILSSYIFTLPKYYTFSYYTLFVLSILFYYFTKEKYQKKILFERILVNLTIYMFSLWGVVIAILDSSRGIPAFVYLINISAIVCFLVATPKELIIFNLINFLAFISASYYYKVLTYPLFVNILFFHIVLVAIGVDKYISISRGIVDKLELNKLNKELKVLSTIDQLSGCKNRRGLLYEIEKYRGQVIFALLTDIDNFKDINDKYGHDIGDLFIVNFAKILQSNFGVNNVYRFGGDEFFIVSNQDSLEICLQKFEISCKEIRSISFVENANVKMTTSAGYVYKVLKVDDNFNHIYKDLDIALYKAKKMGKNTLFRADE